MNQKNKNILVEVISWTVCVFFLISMSIIIYKLLS